MRLIRFGGEAALARVYGRGVLRVIESEPFQMVVMGFIIIAVAGTLDLRHPALEKRPPAAPPPCLAFVIRD